MAMKLKHVLLTLFLGAIWISCNNDDDGLPGTEVEPRDLAEVAEEDDAEIQEFLQTHFYNYEEFQNPPADFDFQIVIDTIAGENSDKTPLSQQVNSRTIILSPEDLDLDQSDADVPHTYYYLSAREGEGIQPTTGDSVLLRYRGTYLDGQAFDAIPNYSWQILPFFLRGYREAMTHFSSATEDSFIVNPDGTSEYTNNGVGMLIIPSGLGYFNNTNQGIIAFSPLIFTVDLGRVIENTDSDGDTVPNFLEDVDGDGDYLNDNTDRDWEQANFNQLIADFQDSDDDADGIPTADEVDIVNGIVSFRDSDGDGTPDHLDSDS